MTQLPREDDTPFSLPDDVPEVMPLDYPELDSGVDLHEAYDEGLDDTVDVDPYRLDDDSVKSNKKLMRAGIGGHEFYSINHEVIRHWMEYRSGHAAHIKGVEDGLDKGGLLIYFDDEEPDVDFEQISWSKFFNILDKNKLAFVFRTTTLSGDVSRSHKFIDRRDVERITEARRIA